MASWVTPRTWVAGDVLTAAQLNEQVRDNTTILRASNVQSVKTVLSAGTTSSATYVDIPGTSVTMTFVKRHLDTSLIPICSLTNVYNTSGAFPLETLGVSISGTDYDVGFGGTVAASVRHSLLGIGAAVTGLAAGNITVKLRIKVAAGVFTTDASGMGNIHVVETS